MPETRTEKGIFALGVLAIAALGLLVAHLWHHTQGVTAASSTALSRPALTTSETEPTNSSPGTTATRSTSHARTTTPANTRPRTTTAPAAGPVALRLTAKSDTWLEVRTASSTGTVLYSGTLAAGSTKLFQARSFWARFGAAGNIFVRLSGKAIRLPSGTYDATFDGRGFRRTSA